MALGKDRLRELYFTHKASQDTGKPGQRGPSLVCTLTRNVQNRLRLHLFLGTPRDSPIVSIFALRSKGSQGLLSGKAGAEDPSCTGHQWRHEGKEHTKDKTGDHNTAALGFLTLADVYNFRDQSESRIQDPDLTIDPLEAFWFFFILSQPTT